MFDKDAKALHEEMQKISKGNLNCLPASRALLFFYEALKIPAKPLVVRPVIFGSVPGVDWSKVFEVVGPEDMYQVAVEGPTANDALDITLPSGVVRIPYRTLGHTHGREPLGSYVRSGDWNGHLGVVVQNTLIDMTIGQINDPRFGIKFDPPYASIETDEKFMTGQGALSGMLNGALVVYRAYPDEKSYETSKAFSNKTFMKDLKTAGTWAASKRRDRT